METMMIKSITSSNRYVMVNVVGFNGSNYDFANILNSISSEGITIDIMNHFVADEQEISFTIKEKYLSEFKALTPALVERFSLGSIQVNENVTKLSIVGIGVKNIGSASQFLVTLLDAKIDIKMISCSEISISCIIDKKDLDRAVTSLNAIYLN